MLHLVIAAVDSNTYLGEAMVTLGEHHVGEFGCGVVVGERGRGIATEALRLLTRWSTPALHLARLQVLVAQKNLPALRLAERVGFRREGLLRSYWGNGESRLDVVMLSMLPGDVASPLEN
jgi:[ribosomal protein S5]-alanine N-acetyltransferase